MIMPNEKERILLTKEMILKGKDKTCFIQVKGFEGELEIRPLTELAWSEVRALTGKETEVSLSAVLNKDGQFDKEATAKNARVKLNMMNVSRNEFEQEVIILKYGLVEPWTEDEIRSISPPGIINKIAEKILEISQLSKEDIKDISFFR